MLSFCGIDVSKDRLDVMVLLEEQCCSVPNDAGGWAALVERGTVRTTKLKEGWYFNSPVTSLASLIVFNTPSGSRAPARTSSSTNRSLPNRLPIANRFLSRSSNPLGVHKLVAQKPDDGADQNCLSVVAAAEQDHDEGDDPAGLNQVPDQLVPVPHHGLQNLFCTNCLISRSDLGLVMQDHVQQGIMNFQFSAEADGAGRTHPATS
jgi:hypothetical protein